MSSPRLAAAGLALAAVGLGAIPLIVREEIPVSHLVGARVTLAAVTLVVVLALMGRLSLPRRYRFRIALAGVLIAVHWAMFFAALKATEVAVALAVAFLGPIAASSLAPRVLGERSPAGAYAGLGIGFAGVLLVTRPGGGATIAGVGWAVGAAVTFALVLLVAKPVAESSGGLVVAAGELVVAAIVLSPWTIRASIESMRFLPLFLVLGVAITGFSFFALWNAMSNLPVTVVSVLMYFEPAFAVVLAAVFLSEAPGAAGWAGVALVVVGGVLAAVATTRGPSTAPSRDPADETAFPGAL